MPKKRVRLLAVGGTISSVRTGSGGGVTPSLTGAQIAESVPEIGEIAEIDVGDFATIPSPSMTVPDMHRLALEAARAFAEGCEGVVVTHGTDTLEETAYALALMLPRERPVVLTGAMRNPTMPGADGPANLYAAFVVATTAEAGKVGPVVVLNDELHAARWATKLHTTRVSTFASPGAGPVGEVVEGRAHIWFHPAYEDHLGCPKSVDGVVVELVRIAAGPEETLLRAAAERNPAGIVLEGTGGGHLPPAVLPVLDEALAAGIPVVLASRCASGRNLEQTYSGFPGAETELIERGILPAGALSGIKARLRLLVGRALGRRPETLFPVR